MAHALAALGHRPVFAVKDLAECAPAFVACPYPVLKAPVWPARPVESFLAASVADILAVHGFDDANDLAATVAGWQSIIDLTGTKFVVAGHAPPVGRQVDNPDKHTAAHPPGVGPKVAVPDDSIH